MASGLYFDPQVCSMRCYRSFGGLELVTLGTKDIPGYANWEHDDPKDINPELQQPCLTMLNNNLFVIKGDDEEKRLRYAKMVVQHVGVGMPTTCGYFLHMSQWCKVTAQTKKRKRELNEVSDDVNLKCFEDELVAFFLMQGLGCGVRLRSHMYHQFHGYAFQHNTCVPYVLKDGYVHFRNTPYNLIAWGDSDEKQRKGRKEQLSLV